MYSNTSSSSTIIPTATQYTNGAVGIALPPSTAVDQSHPPPTGGDNDPKSYSYTYPSRYRGNGSSTAVNPRNDPESWNSQAAFNLRSSYKPAGDLFDLQRLTLFRLALGVTSILTSFLSRCRRRFLPSFFRVKTCLPYKWSPSPSTRRNTIIWLVREPCGLICLSFTWMLIGYAELIGSWIILGQTPTSFWFTGVVGLAFHASALGSFVSHVKAFSTDPGATPLGCATRELAHYLTLNEGVGSKTAVDQSKVSFPPDQQKPESLISNVNRCLRCLSIKPSRAHHCRMCGRCVRKMDHHCPWINNCVGESNQKHFIQFTTYICLMSILTFYMCASYLVRCVSSDWQECQSPPIPSWFFFLLPQLDSVTSSILVCILTALSIIFGLFTLIMTISQLCCIGYDETGIEQLTNSNGRSPHDDSPVDDKPSSFLDKLSLIMGSRPNWRWLYPLDSHSRPATTPLVTNLTDWQVLEIAYPADVDDQCRRANSNEDAASVWLDDIPMDRSRRNDGAVLTL